MKKFTVPNLVHDQKTYSNCYDEESGKIFQYKDNEFIIELKTRLELKSRTDNTTYQYYSISDEIKPVLTKRSQVSNRNNTSLFRNAAQDKNNNVYARINGRYVSLPDLKEHKTSSITLKFIEANFFKQGNKGIISGSFSEEGIVSFFLGDVKVKDNELVLINFYSQNSFDHKIMSFVGEDDFICAVSVSKDGLKGCALVSCNNDDYYEVIIFDLE